MPDLKQFCKIVMPLVFAYASLGVFAHGAISEADLFSEIPTASIASRLDQSAHLTPASVTVINRELIDASGAQNWGDLFRLVPGFQSYSINDNRPGIAYHGFGDEFPNRMEVMVDGRSVYQPAFSAVIWDTLGIQLEDVDHIEIVRGPSAASHGSNAFLGAVNIVTREPLQDKGESIRITGGSRDTLNTWARLNNNIGPLNYRLSLGSRRNNGFPGSSQSGIDDGHELYQIAFRGTMTPTLNDEIDLNFGYADDRLGVGDADHPTYVDTDIYSSYESIEWRHTLASGDEFSLHGYHNNFRLRGSEDTALSELLGITPASVSRTLGIPDQKISEGLGSLGSERFDLEFEHKFSMGKRIRSVWGLGGRTEYAKNQFVQGHDNKIWEESFRWFTHNEWQASAHWVINAGLMVEKTFIGTLLSPRTSLSYLLNPNHTLRMSISRGTRSPSITEANLDQKLELNGVVFNAFIRSADDLEEEEITSYELAWTGHYPAWNLHVDLNLFREQARDAIDNFTESLATRTAFGDDLVKIKSNTGEWETNGVELQMVYRPLPRLLARVHYAYLDLDSDYVKRFEPEKILGDFNESRPRHSGGLLLNYQWTPTLSTGLTAYHQSEVDWRGGNFIDEFTRLDSHATIKFNVGHSAAQVQLIAQNITKDYSEFSEANIFESRYFISVRVDLP